MTRYCPVCLQPVTQTRHGNINGHLDTHHHPCPASHEPYEIAYTATPKETA